MRLLYLVSCFLAGVCVLAAETPVSKPVPPDRKAYGEARKLTDPQKKVDALRAVIQQFPKSRYAEMADELILETMAKNWHDRTDEIRKQAEVVLKREKSSRPFCYDDVADTLQKNGVLLDMAERLSIKAVKAAKGKKYAKERGPFLTTLGLIHLQQGHTAEAQQDLKAALAADPDRAAASEALGNLALKDGRESEAFDYLVAARLSGNIKPESRRTLESLYAKNHGGSMDGFAALLDDAYRKRSPEPLHLKPYQPTPARTGRVVLLELFTGSGCPPCSGADAAVDAAMERYSRKDLAVLAFHQHVPHPDPMANPDTVSRAAYYDVGGVPTLAIDGKTVMGGGPRREAQKTYDRFDPAIEKELDAKPEAQIQLTASSDGGVVKVRASIEGVKSQSKDLRVQIALVEGEVRYSGENGVRFHRMVERAMAGKDGAGFPLSGEKSEAACTFSVLEISAKLKTYLDDYEQHNERYGKFEFIEKKDVINAGDLGVAAFVEDAKDHHVLQAAYLRVAPSQETTR
jgi:tetratricopeptide (TPR) repeat protein